jgi:hypothetical protein
LRLSQYLIFWGFGGFIAVAQRNAATQAESLLPGSNNSQVYLFLKKPVDIPIDRLNSVVQHSTSFHALNATQILLLVDPPVN